jgi:membrane-associated phospholipid phosphatase
MSYPSGHAANAVVWFGLLSYLLRDSISQIAARLGLLTVITITAFASVISGFHWATDTVAGVAAGFIIFLGMTCVADWTMATRLISSLDKTLHRLWR